jgi:hypothetical protein
LLTFFAFLGFDAGVLVFLISLDFVFTSFFLGSVFFLLFSYPSFLSSLACSLMLFSFSSFRIFSATSLVISFLVVFALFLIS